MTNISLTKVVIRQQYIISAPDLTAMSKFVRCLCKLFLNALSIYRQISNSVEIVHVLHKIDSINNLASPSNAE